MSQIFIEAASCENLELLIKKIIELKKEIIQKQPQTMTTNKKSCAINDKK